MQCSRLSSLEKLELTVRQARTPRVRTQKLKLADEQAKAIDGIEVIATRIHDYALDPRLFMKNRKELLGEIRDEIANELDDETALLMLALA